MADFEDVQVRVERGSFEPFVSTLKRLTDEKHIAKEQFREALRTGFGLLMKFFKRNELDVLHLQIKVENGSIAVTERKNEEAACRVAPGDLYPIMSTANELFGDTLTEEKRHALASAVRIALELTEETDIVMSTSGKVWVATTKEEPADTEPTEFEIFYAMHRELIDEHLRGGEAVLVTNTELDSGMCAFTFNFGRSSMVPCQVWFVGGRQALCL